MEKDHYIGILILLGIIAIAAFGGNKNALQNSSADNLSTETQSQTISQQITTDQTQVNQLKTQLQTQELAENHSP